MLFPTLYFGLLSEKEDQLEKEKEKEGEEEVENNLSSLISFPPLYVAIMEWVLNKVRHQGSILIFNYFSLCQ